MVRALHRSSLSTGTRVLVDLHTHTTASDGSLSPAQLLALAETGGVGMLAITDHDTVAAYRELNGVAFSGTLVPGVEFSCRWSGVDVHVVGLGIDLASPELHLVVSQQAAARDQRGIDIAARLEKRGFTGVLAGARKLAGGRPLCRPDFANYLVASGQIASQQKAFEQLLGAGKIGDVKTHWPELPQVIDWIVAAGGVAVLAHPLHYKLSGGKRRRLVAEFKAAGGTAIEVCNGAMAADAIEVVARLAREQSLEASVGSDFHHPEGWARLGRDLRHTGGCQPVWERWIAR